MKPTLNDQWLKDNHFVLRKGSWKRVIDKMAGGITTLVIEETNLDIEPCYGVYLKQKGRMIFLTYTSDADKIENLVNALVNL